MGSITLLLGRTRARRRAALPAETLAGVDGFGRPRSLWITDNPRRLKALEREFLRAQGDQPTFEPRVESLGELLESLAVRHGSGRAILPGRALALLAQRVIEQGGAKRWPWLARVGAPAAVGEALAQLHQHLAEAQRDVLGGVPHEDELRAALAALEHAIRAVPGHRTRADALLELHSLLRDPPPALVEWLRGAHSVILDDLIQPTALRRQLLVQLASTWATIGTHVIFTFEIGQDLGGRAVGKFFGYDDLDDLAWPLKPFTATRALRHELFSQLVGEGSGGIWVAMADQVKEIEPVAAYDGEPDPDLSDKLFVSEPLPIVEAGLARWTGDGALRVLRCADPHDELRAIARDVKRALLDGAHPSDCVVALADLSTRAPALRAAFADHGVPIVLVGGEPLAGSPVARLLRRIAWLPLRGWPAQELLDLLSSDLVARRKGFVPERLAGWCRAANVRDGHPSTWDEPLREHLRFRYTGEELKARLKDLSDSLGALDEICELLQPLEEAATPEQYRQRLLNAADRLGITRRVGRCDEHPDVARVNLLTWGAAVHQLDELVQDLRVVHGGNWPAAELAAQLEEAIQRAAFQPDQAGATRVQVMPLNELRGIYPDRVWVGGLVRGAFPAAPGVPFLLPRRRLRELIPVDAVSEARYLFCSLIRNTVADPEQAPRSLTLSWPSSRDGSGLAPSPLLEDLLQLSTDQLDKDGRPVPLRKLLVTESDAASGEPLARSDLLRAAARSPDWRALVGRPDVETIDHQGAVAKARAKQAPFGPYDGLLQAPPEPPETLAVTALEGYLRCPARYWYGRILRLGPPEEWQPELAADRRGTAIHRILEEYMGHIGLRSLEGAADPEALANQLHQVATKVFAEVEAEGGFDAQLFKYDCDRWTAGLLDERPKGILRAWLDAEIAGQVHATPIAVEQEFTDLKVGPILLKGTLDRLDEVDGGLLVTDYKTGKAPSHKLVERGLMLQPVAYGEAVAQRFPGKAVASCYYELKRPDELKRTSWVGDSDLIDSLASRRKDAGARISPLRRRQLLDHAAQAAHRLARGRFHTTLAGEEDGGCVRCDFVRVCRVDHDRGEQQDAAQADLQAPLPEDSLR